MIFFFYKRQRRSASFFFNLFLPSCQIFISFFEIKRKVRNFRIDDVLREKKVIPVFFFLI